MESSSRQGQQLLSSPRRRFSARSTGRICASLTSRTCLTLPSRRSRTPYGRALRGHAPSEALRGRTIRSSRRSPRSPRGTDRGRANAYTARENTFSAQLRASRSALTRRRRVGSRSAKLSMRSNFPPGRAGASTPSDTGIVLPSPGGIGSGSLEMPRRIGADPCVGPGWWDRESPDPRERLEVAHTRRPCPSS